MSGEIWTPNLRNALYLRKETWTERSVWSRDYDFIKAKLFSTFKLISINTLHLPLSFCGVFNHMQRDFYTHS